MSEKKYDIYINNQRVGEVVEQEEPIRDDTYKYDLIIESANRLVEGDKNRGVKIARGAQKLAKDDMKSNESDAKERARLRAEYARLSEEMKSVVSNTKYGRLSEKVKVAAGIFKVLYLLFMLLPIVWGILRIFEVVSFFTWWSFLFWLPFMIVAIVLSSLANTYKNKGNCEIDEDYFEKWGEQLDLCYDQLKACLEKVNYEQYIHYYIHYTCAINKKTVPQPRKRLMTAEEEAALEKSAKRIVSDLKEKF